MSKAETSIQGRRRTRSMINIKTPKVTNSKCIHVISSPNSDGKEFRSSPKEIPSLASTSCIPFDIAQGLEAKSPIQSSPSKNLIQKVNAEVQQASS